ncbi:MAG: hypothetical protein U1E76_22310 [Planctomycetota bacterium]
MFVLYGPWTLVPSPTTPPYAGGAIGIVEDVYHRNNPPNDTYGDRFGFRNALGDPNQDGYPDLVVGSPYSLVSPGVNQDGEAYVYWGPSFAAWLELVLPWDPATYYPSINDRLWGWDVACGNVADWERAANDDIIVAAYNSDNPGSGGNHGWIRVFRDYMGSSPPAAQVVDIRRPGGDRDQSDFGAAINLGKYYGSTYLDMAVGAPYDDNTIQYGEVHVFQGGPGFPSNAYSFTRDIDGYQIMDKFGFDVDFLGDQNGDGRSELVVGAPWFSTGAPGGQNYGPGRVIVRRSNGGSSYINDPNPEVLAVSWWYGWGSALAVGKIDANSQLDLAIGNARTTDPATQTEEAGEVRVVVYHY